ncbi:MAG: sensor histidine kinase N-terminal domain-containing protein [Ideonella sp.]
MLSFGAEAANGPPSLRARLARHVLLPLALTWSLGAIVVTLVGYHFAAQAFDEALLDDAYTVAAHVHHDGQQFTLDLSPREIRTLLFDPNESMYFTVRGPDDRVVAGEAELPAARIREGSVHEFDELSFKGQHVRSVSLRRDKAMPFVVVMAQTTTGRTRLLWQLLVLSTLVQIGLLLVLAWWLDRSIERDLRPLTELQQVVSQRDSNDLAQLPAALTDGATTRDVQHLGTAVNALLSRLQESLTAQREFAGTVAHELRTPLAGIRAQATYALAQDDAALWRHELQGIVQAELRASRLVDQLLALARADEGRAGLNIQAIALDELVREVMLRLMPRADALGVDLGAEGLEPPVVIRGDLALVEGILTNLLDNALRYGGGGSSDTAPRVTVSIRLAGGAPMLCVIDNGPGLGAVDARQLTRRWAQGVRGQAVGQGAGLGLAIVVRYVDLLGAELTLDPATDGTGLCACVRFQAADRNPDSDFGGHSV